MTIDQLINALEVIRADFGGSAEVRVVVDAANASEIVCVHKQYYHFVKEAEQRIPEKRKMPFVEIIGGYS